MTLIERSSGDFFRQKVTTSIHQDRLIFFNEVIGEKNRINNPIVYIHAFANKLIKIQTLKMMYY